LSSEACEIKTSKVFGRALGAGATASTFSTILARGLGRAAPGGLVEAGRGAAARP
jgi:hypothetical protein